MFLHESQHRWLPPGAGGVSRQPHKAAKPPVTAGMHGAAGGKT